MRRVALSLFELVDGAALFEERASSIPLEYMVSLSIHRLLYDGIRLMKSQDLVVSALGALDRQPPDGLGDRALGDVGKHRTTYSPRSARPGKQSFPGARV